MGINITCEDSVAYIKLTVWFKLYTCFSLTKRYSHVKLILTHIK